MSSEGQVQLRTARQIVSVKSRVAGTKAGYTITSERLDVSATV